MITKTAQEARSVKPNYRTKARELLSRGLTAGGKALYGYGVVDPYIQKYNTVSKLKKDQKVPYGSVERYFPNDLEVIRDPDKIHDRVRRLYGYNMNYPYPVRKVIDYVSSPVSSEINSGYNSFYIPGNLFNKNQLLINSGDVNKSIAFHELGHDRAKKHWDYLNEWDPENTDDYKTKVMKSKLYDNFGLPYPSEMWQSPSESTFFGNKYTTLPGIEREAWNMAPAQSEINPEIREAALKTYEAQREARAKRFFGRMGTAAGKLLKPKDKVTKK